MLQVMGDGFQAEQADRVAAWMISCAQSEAVLDALGAATQEGVAPSAPDVVPPDQIMGLADVAMKIARSRQAVWNWIDQGRNDFPRPFARVSATPLFDGRLIDEWIKAHPELCGDRMDDVA